MRFKRLSGVVEMGEKCSSISLAGNVSNYLELFCAICRFAASDMSYDDADPGLLAGN